MSQPSANRAVADCPSIPELAILLVAAAVGFLVAQAFFFAGAVRGR